MKNIVALTGRKSIVTPLALTLLGALAGTFWFATSQVALAGVEPTCTVCHKRSQTLTYPCNSLEYRRHLDHGDPMGACAVTPVTNP